MSTSSAADARRKTRASHPTVSRDTLYADVTNRIIAELEGGRVPWVQPWDGTACDVDLPRNAATRRPYSGINILLLGAAVIQHGWPSQGWLTFRQTLDAGGRVRKGEQGTTVVYADRFTPEAERERADRDGTAPRSIAFLKRFTAFNVAQCEGLPEHLTRTAPPSPALALNAEADALIGACPARFRIEGARAFYAPVEDYLQVPPQSAFYDPINFYRTIFHELGHWAGGVSRLARDQSGAFGSAPYAREEMCAEMASAFLCASLGIVPTVRHSDYIASWLDVLRADNRAIFRAASHASKAADYLLAFRPAPSAEQTA